MGDIVMYCNLEKSPLYEVVSIEPMYDFTYNSKYTYAVGKSDSRWTQALPISKSSWIGIEKITTYTFNKCKSNIVEHCEHSHLSFYHDAIFSKIKGHKHDIEEHIKDLNMLLKRYSSDEETIDILEKLNNL